MFFNQLLCLVRAAAHSMATVVVAHGGLIPCCWSVSLPLPLLTYVWLVLLVRTRRVPAPDN